MLNQNVLDIIVKVYHLLIPVEIRKKMKPMLNCYILMDSIVYHTVS